MLAIMLFALFFVLSDSRPFFDEGIYLTSGWLFSNGVPPYSGFFESKPIGIYSVGALLFSVFPATVFTARIFMALIGILALALIMLVSNRVFGEKGAIISGAFFVFLSLVFGSFWFVIEPFVSLLVLFSVFSYLEFLQKNSKKWLSVSILALAAAVFFKQTAVLIAVLLSLFFLFNEMRAQKSRLKGLFEFLPALIPSILLAAIVFAFLFFTNSFSFFVEYLFLFHASNLGYYGGVILSLKFLPFLAAVILPCVLLLAVSAKKIALKKEQKTLLAILTLWLAGSTAMLLPLLGCCMHFIPLLPALAILSGFCFVLFWEKGLVCRAFLLAVLFAVVLGGVSYAFIYSQQQYGFSSIREIAYQVQGLVPENNKILVLQSSPELYFLSGRMPAAKALFYSDVQYPESFIAEEIQLLSRPETKIAVVFSRGGEFTDANPAIDSFVKQNFVLAEKKQLKFPLYGYYGFALIFEKKQ